MNFKPRNDRMTDHQTGVRMSQETWERVSALSEKSGIPKATIMRQCIEYALDHME